MKYTEAINLDKTKAVYYSNRAACYTELKNYSKAAADGKKCFELDGRFAKGYYRYAKAKKMLGDTKEAIKYARHGISIDPACEDLRHLLVQELGVLESDLPENPNKNAQIQPIVAEGSVPVVQGMAVPEQQTQPQLEVQQQQQPMMMQGQQPMMMQGQPAPGQRGSMPGQGNNNEVATAAMAGLIGGALMGGMFG